MYSFTCLWRTAIFLAKCSPDACSRTIRDMMCLPREVVGPAFDRPLDLSALDSLRPAVGSSSLPANAPDSCMPLQSAAMTVCTPDAGHLWSLRAFPGSWDLACMSV